MTKIGRFFIAVLALSLVAAVGGGAFAADYDWREPGKAELDAVLSALAKPGTDAMAELLDDGLDADEFFPVEGSEVPLLSLALGAGRAEVVEVLLYEGADVDLMSTRETRRTESLPYKEKNVRRK